MTDIDYKQYYDRASIPFTFPLLLPLYCLTCVGKFWMFLEVRLKTYRVLGNIQSSSIKQWFAGSECVGHTLGRLIVGLVPALVQYRGRKTCALDCVGSRGTSSPPDALHRWSIVNASKTPVRNLDLRLAATFEAPRAARFVRLPAPVFRCVGGPVLPKQGRGAWARFRWMDLKKYM